MSIFGTSSSTSSSGSSKGKSKTKLPDWVNEAGQNLYGEGLDIYNQGFNSYYGDGVSGMNQDQLGGIDRMNQWGNETGVELLNDAVGSSQAYGSAGPQSTDFYSMMGDAINDESGNMLVGSLEDYMNPYQEAVTNQQLRGNEQDYMKNMMDNRRRAQMSGGFGDARHGTSDSISRGEMRQSGSDIRERGALASYNQALGLRGSEMDRYNQHQQSQNQYELDALNRQREGMGEAYNRAYEGEMANIGALMEAGNLQQNQAQREEDFEYNEFLRAEDHPYKNIAMLGATLGMAPYETGQKWSGTNMSNSETSSGGGLGSILGAAGSLFKAF